MIGRVRRILPMFLAAVIGAGAGAGVTLALRPSSSHWTTLPTAYGVDGRRHVVDPVDCHPDDPGYSGRAVCSWVRNP